MTTTIERTVTTTAPPEKVFPYLADFRTLAESMHPHVVTSFGGHRSRL